MKRLLLSLFITSWILFTGSFSPLQAQDVEFSASQLQEITIKYTGNAVNWPVVASLAQHDISENRFTLSNDAVLRLSNFGQISQKISGLKTKINELVKSGATIFAGNELEKTKNVVSDYQQAIRNGNIEAASKLADQLAARVNQLDSTLKANRVVNIQAELERKSGNVDKRRGILGSWQEAFEGDRFRESDGIKTFTKSYANLAFVDGSKVTVNPQTVAIIRKSRIDKLNKSVDTEITLQEGGLLAELSAGGKEEGNYILEAGPSSTQLESQRFMAETGSESRVQLTNYDGIAHVNSNNVTVSIRKDEGTIVEEGKDPLPPVELVPPPEITWSKPDTIIYQDSLMISFLPQNRANSYLVETSPSRNFDEDVETYSTQQTSELLEELQIGITYLRVQSIDSLGLRGPTSSTYRIIRNKDTQPPPIFFTDISDETIYTTNSVFTLKGVSEPGARISVNEERVQLNNAGTFSTTVDLPDKENMITISAIDGSDNETTRRLTLVKVEASDLLNNIKWNAELDSDTIDLQTPELTLSGIAYPGFTIHLESGKTDKKVRTDLNGRWGIALQSPGDEIRLTFVDRSTGNRIITKRYTINHNY